MEDMFGFWLGRNKYIRLDDMGKSTQRCEGGGANEILSPSHRITSFVDTLRGVRLTL